MRGVLQLSRCAPSLACTGSRKLHVKIADISAGCVDCCGGGRAVVVDVLWWWTCCGGGRHQVWQGSVDRTKDSRIIYFVFSRSTCQYSFWFSLIAFTLLHRKLQRYLLGA
ncbi:Ricin B lectin domain [Trinorchestia longiramus]|nr:Ricin B lectin domain [Trinorchestia longiramus]